MSRARAGTVFSKTLLALAVIVLLLYVLFPFLVAANTALKTKAEIYGGEVRWIPKHPTLRNFIEIWGQISFARYLLNSIIVCIGTSGITTMSATMAAYALAHMKFRLNKLYLNLVILTQMFSPIVLIIPLYRMLVNIKMSNNLFGLIILNSAVILPFTIWLAYGFFKSFPTDILEAADIDGCSGLNALFRIILPIVRPGVVTLIIYTFAFAWNEFLFAYTIITKSRLKVVAVGIFDFDRMYNADWNYITAALLVAIVPIFVLFLLIEKNVVKGLAEGVGK
jgi:multiple sugar transport system permease protein